MVLVHKLFANTFQTCVLVEDHKELLFYEHWWLICGTIVLYHPSFSTEFLHDAYMFLEN